MNTIFRSVVMTLIVSVLACANVTGARSATSNDTGWTSSGAVGAGDQALTSGYKYFTVHGIKLGDDYEMVRRALGTNFRAGEDAVCLTVTPDGKKAEKRAKAPLDCRGFLSGASASAQVQGRGIQPDTVQANFDHLLRVTKITFRRYGDPSSGGERLQQELVARFGATAFAWRARSWRAVNRPDPSGIDFTLTVTWLQGRNFESEARNKYLIESVSRVAESLPRS